MYTAGRPRRIPAAHPGVQRDAPLPADALADGRSAGDRSAGQPSAAPARRAQVQHPQPDLARAPGPVRGPLAADALGRPADLRGDRRLEHNPVWLGIGFFGQALFFGRLFVQWLASERHKKSVIPRAFWFLSLGGGLVLLAYAIHRNDPVFIVGQATGLFIYTRNLWFIYRPGQPYLEPAASAETD